MRFSVVIFESVLLHFACYCIFIRFSILKSVASYSYAETIISDLLNTRSGQGQGRGQDDRVKSIFRSNDCKPPTDDVVDVGIFMMSLVLRYRNSHDMSCRRVATFFWRYIYDVIELWNGQWTLRLSRRS